MVQMAGETVPLKAALEASPRLRMQDWQAGQARESLQNLLSYAGAPMGDQPFNVPAPPAMMPDYSMANMYSDIGNLGTTALWYWLNKDKTSTIPVQQRGYQYPGQYAPYQQMGLPYTGYGGWV